MWKTPFFTNIITFGNVEKPVDNVEKSVERVDNFQNIPDYS